jgi:hypothetical protein
MKKSTLYDAKDVAAEFFISAVITLLMAFLIHGCRTNTLDDALVK